ncbi:MAG: ATP-dependent endonuclease [Acidobacterium ailaaui]|nr:ATP-dependent endonuclease [Pseudacidobacterium ailaaui]
MITIFIKSLTIKNFRCFDKEGATIELNDGLTAFIGRNGSGKTAILEALNFLIGQEYLPIKINEKDFHGTANDIKDEIFIEAETKSPFFLTLDVRSNTNQLETVVIPCNKIRLTIKRREKPEKVLDEPFIINKYVLPVTGEIDESIYEGKETARRAIRISQIKEGYTVFYKLKSGDVRSAKIISYQLNYTPNRLTKCPKSYYLSKDREDDVSGSYSSLLTKILTDLHWKYKRERSKKNSNSIEDEYNTLAESLRGIVDEKEEIIRQINDKIKSISSSNKDFQIDFIDIEQPYRSAFVAKKEGEKLLLPEHLGSGFNILIAYALFAYIADQEKIPIVLIIDEPELHLHSDWQKKMYEVFSTQGNLQIVYSTQSENLISLKNCKQIRSIADFQVFPKQEVLQENVSATDGVSATRAEFLDDYAKRNLHISTILRENLELFFVRKVILAEGPAEKYGLPKLLKLAGCAIEDKSVAIIPVWGKGKIKIYQMICKVFGIDYFTAFDNDKATDDEPDGENTAIENNAQDGKYVKFSTSFEALLGVSGNNKFQELVKVIDRLTDINTVDNEIHEAVDAIKDFIENGRTATD